MDLLSDVGGETVGVLASVGIWGGVVVMAFGIAKLAFVPLALVYEVREAMRAQSRRRASRGRHRRGRRPDRSRLLARDPRPTVSVVVPAYNEGPVLAHCVRSLLESHHVPDEVVVVDDGSTDDTAAVLAALAAESPCVVAVTQANAGKGAALNRGIAESRGEVLLFVDADGIFAPHTIGRMLDALQDPRVGAVCGDDRPVNVDRLQTRLLAVLNHAGTGLVRRGLAVLGCLPIVSGNIGAFPRRVVEEVGGFDQHTLGEDLELTWRVHRAGYRVAFQPRALVYAEAPSTPGDLWRQRVRWGRGLLQTMRLHRDMIGNPRYGVFGLYLVVNTLTMVVMPIVHLVVLACVPFAFLEGRAPFSESVPSLVGWLGLALSLATVAFSICLNGAFRDLRYLWTVVAWPVYSTAMGAVAAAALWRELRGRDATWDKMERTGVVTVRHSQ